MVKSENKPNNMEKHGYTLLVVWRKKNNRIYEEWIRDLNFQASFDMILIHIYH